RERLCSLAAEPGPDRGVQYGQPQPGPRTREVSSMARFLLPTLVLGGFLVLPAPAARAADAEPPKGAPPQHAEFLKASPEEIIRRFDKNNDGLLSPDEAPPFLKRFFERADTNGDGKLDKEELAAVQKMLRQRFGQAAGGPSKEQIERTVAMLLE